MMNILVYEMNLNGHRLEYIHHLYMLAFDMPEDHFYFVLSERFKALKDMLIWPDAANVTIVLIPCEDKQPQGRLGLKALYDDQKSEANSINRFIEQYRIDRLFAISIIRYIPFFPIFLSKKVKVDGIQYSLFPWADRNIILRNLDYVKYLIYKLFPCFVNVYTLNDQLSAERLNKFFHTSKFKLLPDPFVQNKQNTKQNFRQENGIDSDKIVFAHFGGLQSRKGTMKILQSLTLLTEEQKKKYVFVFAGRVYDEIKEDFYNACSALKSTTNIIVKDEFCDYDYLSSLCIGCNAILIPYLATNQSSGLIGYSSQYGKPVIAPSSGIIGRLVTGFKLGITLSVINEQSLVDAYRAIEKGMVDSPSDEYCKINSIEEFQRTIKNGFKN